MNRLEEVKKYGKKAKGKLPLIRHLEGKRITRKDAIDAKCYECNGYCADGVEECNIRDCPLWPYSPFRRKDESST